MSKEFEAKKAEVDFKNQEFERLMIQKVIFNNI